ncbi:MAG: alpha/beta hydrolase [Burkholderiaceae bacterium]|nr:alpha/beta hydrolase [Burkholderiaceae bacterium]
MPESTARSRISAPNPDTLAPEGRAVFDAAVRTFGAPLGPRIPLLHSPDLAVAWSQMGLALRKSPLKPALRELAILVVGQHWRADFEWYAHAPKAAAAGITAAQLDDIRNGRTPSFEDEETRIVYDYCRELVVSRRVSDETYSATRRLLGERLIVDLTALAGHFTNVAMTLNAHLVQLPPGVPSPFGDLASQPRAPEAFRTGWVGRGDVALRYRLRAGVGPTLVFVHELGGTAESWDSCIAQLPPGRSVVCVEWRGSGLSSKVHEAVQFEQIVEDLQQVVSEVCAPGPIVLIGVAAGAGIAMAVAARHPQRVAAVVAIVPALGTPPEQRAGVAQFADRVEREGMQSMMGMERTYPQVLRDQHPQRWADFRLRYLGNDARSYAHLLRMVMAIDLAEDIKRIRCPALVIGGAHDIRPVDMMQALANRLPKGRFEEIPAGHFMPSQAPDLVAQAIERFVVALPACAAVEGV